MGVAQTRLDTIAALDGIFLRAEPTLDNAGAWIADAGGSTGSSNTGPSTDSSGPYVYTEASGGNVTTLPTNSVITALATVMAAWTGMGRILALRASIAGTGTFSTSDTSGMEISGRADSSDPWTVIELLEGWAYATTRAAGSTLTDSAGDTQAVAQVGGWVDYEVTIPDSYTELRIRIAPGTSSFFRHDMALWHVELRDGGGTPPPPPPPATTDARDYRVRVDWDGDGLFNNIHADITADGNLVALPKYVRGRSYADQIYGRSEAGYFEAVLRNSHGLYNRVDNTSDLVDLVVPGRLVEFAVRRSGQSTYRVHWSGLLDDVQPQESQSGRNRVLLTAFGPLSLITQTDVSVAAYANIGTDTALGHVFDAADVPAARRGTVNGDRTMARWWSPLQTGIRAARELEETELGFLHETKADAQIAMDAENARLTGSGRTSQFTLTRDGDPGPGEIGLISLELNDPIQDIVNFVTVPIRSYSDGAEETLWESMLVPVEIPSGATMSFIAAYPNPDSASNRVGVAEWTDMVGNTDYQAFDNADGSGVSRTSSLTITETKAGNTLAIEVENAHSGSVHLTRLRARGTPLIEGSTTSIPVKDDASILEYKKRDYQIPSQFISTLLDAESYGGFLVRVLKDPQTRAQGTFSATRYEEEADDVDLSQRVILRRHGISGEMFVEGVRGALSEGGRHTVGLLLSPADVFGDVIVLGTGPGLGTGILGR